MRSRRVGGSWGIWRMPGAVEGERGAWLLARVLSKVCLRLAVVRSRRVGLVGDLANARSSRRRAELQHELHFGDVEPAAELSADFAFDADDAVTEGFVKRYGAGVAFGDTCDHGVVAE